MRRKCTPPESWFDTDEHTRLAIALAKSMNRPDFAKSRSAFIWLYYVSRLLESMQTQQWSFGSVTHAPSADDDGLSATVVFTCEGISVTAEFGVFGAPDNLSVWMGIDDLGRVAEFEDFDFKYYRAAFTSDMKVKIYERQFDLAWKAGPAAQR